MKFLGLFLLVIGVISLLLPLMGANLLFLNWVDQWGTTVSWSIRIGVTVLGALLYYTNRHDD